MAAFGWSLVIGQLPRDQTNEQGFRAAHESDGAPAYTGSTAILRDRIHEHDGEADGRRHVNGQKIPAPE
jgi:hypothetical protein